MKSFWNEQWQEIEISAGSNLHRKHYAVSNYGRVISYTDDPEAGKLLKCTPVEGYAVLSIRHPIKYGRCVHRLVAHYFLPPPLPDQTNVVHLDFDKQNNSVKNLQWASHEDMLRHNENNPNVQFARQNPTKRTKGAKLTDRQVKRIKNAINDPNRKRTYKQIAQRYGISEMQLYRIKSGKNWGHVS